MEGEWMYSRKERDQGYWGGRLAVKWLLLWWGGDDLMKGQIMSKSGFFFLVFEAVKEKRGSIYGDY